ncbi:MAG: DUF4402 domain-containing protein [Bacteroidales bacterium]|jgi:spore coat protein U-like protein
MKTTLKIFALTVALFGITNISFGQDTSTAAVNASANIITPISIVKVKDINFGDLVPSATTAVTVVMDQTGSITSDAQYFLANSSTPRTAASFTISGKAGHAYKINCPTTIALEGPGDDMTLTFDPSLAINGTTLTLTGGTQTLNLGGSLALGTNQTAGAYSKEFDVTVAYE